MSLRRFNISKELFFKHWFYTVHCSVYCWPEHKWFFFESDKTFTIFISEPRECLIVYVDGVSVVMAAGGRTTWGVSTRKWSNYVTQCWLKLPSWQLQWALITLYGLLVHFHSWPSKVEFVAGGDLNEFVVLYNSF